MKFSSIKRKFIFLLLVKKVWTRPKSAKILIYDRSGSELFLTYLENRQLEILDTRGESLNMPALFQSLIRNRKKKSYESCYIDIVDPKVVITFIDNNPAFYCLKIEKPSLITIFVQNGLRSIVGDIFSHFHENINNAKVKYRVDHMLCFGNAIGDKYSEYIDGKYTAIGSLKNNMFERSTLPVKEKSILFVSQYRRKPVSSAPMMHNMAEAIYWEQFFLPEVFFLPLLSAFCKRNGFQLQVCGCLDEAAEIEKNFYKELLGTDGWEFIPRNEKTISYHLVDTAAYVFMIDSTLGYEAMARGKKVAAFPVRGQVINSEACNFGWPAKVPETGPFWTNTMSENEFDRIMNYILNVNDEEWGNVLRTYISDLLIYDPGNSIFLKLMKQLQVSLN